jgi:hypothetical protein
MGPKAPRLTVLTADEETLIVAFRRHTLLPLDDCLYVLQSTVPHLTRSSLHRLFQRYGVSRLPTAEGTRPRRQLKAYPMGYVHIDLAEVWTSFPFLQSALSSISFCSTVTFSTTSPFFDCTSLVDTTSVGLMSFGKQASPVGAVPDEPHADTPILIAAAVATRSRQLFMVLWVSSF